MSPLHDSLLLSLPTLLFLNEAKNTLKIAHEVNHCTGFVVLINTLNFFFWDVILLSIWGWSGIWNSPRSCPWTSSLNALFHSPPSPQDWDYKWEPAHIADCADFLKTAYDGSLSGTTIVKCLLWYKYEVVSFGDLPIPRFYLINLCLLCSER